MEKLNNELNSATWISNLDSVEKELNSMVSLVAKPVAKPAANKTARRIARVAWLCR